ncbi:MAG: hypothetical protein ACI8P9_005387 [Parasphingorhabdus sp.]
MTGCDQPPTVAGVRNIALNNDRFHKERLGEEPAPRSALGTQRAVMW